MSSSYIKLRDAVARNAEKRLAEPINFSLEPGEHIAIIGLNGSGKSLLADTVRGYHPICSGEATYNLTNDNSIDRDIASITFRNEYEASDFYFQQRWNSTEHDNSPVIGQVLEKIACDDDMRSELYALLEIEPLLGKQVVMLSSGELRRFHLLRTLLSKPRVLIVDNLYVGLDSRMRDQLADVIDRIISAGQISLISVCAQQRDIPRCTTHFYALDALHLGPKLPYDPAVDILADKYDNKPAILPLFKPRDEETESTPVVEFRNISIGYGQRRLFNGFSWTVRRGEKWLLTGYNGSGKTTLLGLINADNPQAYAQDLSLFGRRRGTGESIWDIKQRISFVSPEMLRGYLVNLPALDIVSSGFFDTVGLYSKPSSDQRRGAMLWMECFGIGHLAERSFMRLSSGEQRMVLLARAFVKEPELLILDEPLHEIDRTTGKALLKIIEAYAALPGKTLIYVSHYEEEVPNIITNRINLSPM